jgi:hypothetical protein
MWIFGPLAGQKSTFSIPPPNFWVKLYPHHLPRSRQVFGGIAMRTSKLVPGEWGSLKLATAVGRPPTSQQIEEKAQAEDLVKSEFTIDAN